MGRVTVGINSPCLRPAFLSGPHMASLLQRGPALMQPFKRWCIADLEETLGVLRGALGLQCSCQAHLPSCPALNGVEEHYWCGLSCAHVSMQISKAYYVLEVKDTADDLGAPSLGGSRRARRPVVGLASSPGRSR